MKERTAENARSACGSAVASAWRTSNPGRASRCPSEGASTGSNSTAVSFATSSTRTSVVRPGPGPISKTSSPSSRPSKTSGMMYRPTVSAHSALEQSSRCSWFNAAPLS